MALASQEKETDHSRIAVIGLGCYYPGAKTPLQLWENILSRKQQFREMPDLRLPNKEYYDPDPAVKDKTYQNKAAVMDGYRFDWLDRRIPKRTFESTDIVHWLALDTAIHALEDANYSKNNIPGNTTGVIIGNTLTGEFTRSNQMLLRWPYVRKVLHASMKNKGLLSHYDKLETVMEQYYKSVFAPVTEDTLAGGLANTIAGRVCNYLDLHGGGYTVDGACSSSLLAICTAANYLELKQMDMVIAGGVDVSLDTFELVGFAKTGALTQDEMRVYDKNGKGFIPGEGCGMVVLKRLEDARRDNDKIYAILNGWGISSDGKGGITAPKAEGQAKALIRAYHKAGFDTENLDFIEGHGTGTTVGDRTELEGITLALNISKELPRRNCGVTSFKSIVGHTKAAAGVGAFIKTVMALNRRILPPTAGLKEFNPIFEEGAKTIYPILHGQVRNPNDTLYAGVSAMGFGGINSHVLLQSGHKPYPHLQPEIEEQKLMVSNQTHELFLFASENKEGIINFLGQAMEDAKGISYAELADFACYTNRKADPDKFYRAAVVAATPFELIRKLKILRDKIISGSEQFVSLESDTVIFGQKDPGLKVGALFPGQGSQRLNMARKLTLRYDWAAECVEQARKIFTGETDQNIIDSIFKPTERAGNKVEVNKWRDELKQTNVAQPAITLASVIWKHYLEKLGLTLHAVSGHSLGELMSFHVAGYYNEETVLKFAAFRGKMMAECGSGTMASLVCSQDLAKEYIDKTDGYATIANINAPEQTVISGDKESIQQIIKLAEKDHIGAVELPVSTAFHSKLIAETADAIKDYTVLKQGSPTRDNIVLISSVTGNIVEKKVDLQQYFSHQAVSQVNFVQAIEKMAEECDVLIEIGPGKVLSGLTANITDKVKCFPVEAWVNNDELLQVALANLFVRGMNIRVEELYKNRLIREFVPARSREFIVNPLERSFPAEFEQYSTSGQQATDDIESLLGELGITSPFFHEYISYRSDFVKDMILTDLKYFTQPDQEVKTNGNNNKVQERTDHTKKPEDVPGSVNSGVREVLVRKIEAATGFPALEFKDDMRLLDDFNLDSIKAGTLLGGLTKDFNIQGKINPSELANASIGQVVERFEQLVEPVSREINTGNTIQEKVVTAIADSTGFPVEEIHPEFKLLEDLNLDSIKVGTLLGRLMKEFGLQGKIEPAQHANASVRQIIDKITELTGEKPVRTMVSQHTVKEENVQQLVFEAVTESTGFPVEEIKPEFKLLEDLNLDSIKAGALIAALSKKFNIMGKIEPVRYANASLAEIIAAIESVWEKSAPANVAQEPAKTFWVKSFTGELIEETLDNVREKVKDYWKDKNIGIIHAVNNKQKALALASRLKNNVRQVDVSSYERIHKDNYRTTWDTLLVLLPEVPYGAGTTESVELLSAGAEFWEENTLETGFIQIGDGYFGRKNDPKTNLISAAAFAASLHLEHPHTKIRVMESGPSVMMDQLVEQILNEFANNTMFSVAGFDSDGIRRRMVYDLANTKHNVRKNILYNENDVVLVTGGAKGITAECALALAEKYRCRMVLVGSSAMNKEVKHTLERYTSKELSTAYYSCDITNADVVRKLVETVEREIGKITGVVHGAGKNVPRRAGTVSAGEALKEIAPKLMGAINLMKAFENKQLHSFVAFTSIIGITGMPGNSWYAFSNETLDQYLRNYRTLFGTETLSLAYSVWSEVGMGAKMGSTETLGRMGIDAIPPRQGIDTFLQWIENEPTDQQVVIASRLGGLDTWYRKPSASPEAQRYTERIMYHEPGVELRVRCNLSRNVDLYANDHNYNGSLLFPTVFGLEAMAQSVARVLGLTDLSSLRMENISLLKPIVVSDDPNSFTEIEIATEVLESDKENLTFRVRAGISTEQTNFRTYHFSAEFIVGDKDQPELHRLDLPSDTVALDPKQDLYGWLLFQGPMFRNMENIYTLTANETIFRTAKLEDDTSGICLSGEKRSPFIIGSPLLRDVLLQSIQLLLTQKKYLPVRIRQWDIYNLKEQQKGGVVQCKLIQEKESVGTCDVLFVNKGGQVLERIQGYEVKALEPTAHYPLPEELADLSGLYNQKINNELKAYEGVLKNKPEIVVHKHSGRFADMKLTERHELEQQIFSHYFGNNPKYPLLNKELLHWSSENKPYLKGTDYDISVAHCQSVLIMTLGNEGQGCDIEKVEIRNADAWFDLLGHKYREIFDELKDTDRDTNVIGTRLWCMQEAAFKALGKVPESVRIGELSGNLVFFDMNDNASTIQIMTLSVEFLPGRKWVIAMVAERQEKNAGPIIKDSRKQIEMYDPRSGKFKYEFLTTFKDCNGFHGKTYFTNFPQWMGHLRELVLRPIAPQLLKDLSPDNYGMVTNESGIRIYNEAEALNTIEGRIWITDKSDFSSSFIDLNFEWLKHTDSGKTIKLADCNLSTTWVKIEGRGIVKKSSIPDYFLKFLTQYIRKSDKNELSGRNAYLTLGDMGEQMYRSRSMPRPEILLLAKVYQTGLYDSNTVGNLYYSNYYDWQAKSIENFLYALSPETFLSGGKTGEFVSLASSVNHLQEAMPFEDIQVNMFLENVYSNGISLYFDYYSLKDGKRKLAYGRNDLIWVTRHNNDLLPKAVALPKKILFGLKKAESSTFAKK